MSTGSIISEILLLSERLAGLLDREVEALRRDGPQAVAVLQAEKTALIAAYEAQLTEVRSQRGAIGASPADRETVAAAARRLDTAVARNARALEAARDVNARLMEAIVRAATAQHAQTRGYAGLGGAAGPTQATRREAVSIALDRRL